ncbi:unnamed protein product [Soboliphyme baturini]|uniref:FH2 domain-containing protein n=1 Tax=Soboliphyme baturini TaxID=241478 RepID=A0A183J1D8_9BILA|nr:unnamed protein product [Soboliphyme baturini]
MAKTKADSWGKFPDVLELKYQTVNKAFWQTIRRLRDGKKGSLKVLKDKSRHPLTEDKDISRQWPGLPVFRSIFIRMLASEHESWAELKPLIRDTSPELSSLRRIDVVRSTDISKSLHVLLLLLQRNHSHDGLGICCRCF